MKCNHREISLKKSRTLKGALPSSCPPRRPHLRAGLVLVILRLTRSLLPLQPPPPPPQRSLLTDTFPPSDVRPSVSVRPRPSLSFRRSAGNGRFVRAPLIVARHHAHAHPRPCHLPSYLLFLLPAGKPPCPAMAAS